MLESDPIVRAKARAIISGWGFDDPSQIDLHVIAAEMGLLIVEKPIEGSAARLICDKERGIIAVNEDIHESGRKRFATAHELGHFILHRSQSNLKICTEDSFLNWYSRADIESESNIFAAELLMPVGIFDKVAKRKPPAFSWIVDLSEDFLTSVTATAIRYVEISGHACALVAGSEGKVKWISKSANFPHRILGCGETLHSFSCAGEYFLKKTRTSGAETVSGEAWLEDRGLGQKLHLKEELLVMPSYGLTLSLIWLIDNPGKPRDWYAEDYLPTQSDPEHFTPDGKRYRW